MARTGSDVEQSLITQRIAFWLAVTDCLAVTIWIGIRVYFAAIGNPVAERQFVLHPAVLELFPVVVLVWIISFVTVGNSLTRTRRASSYGIWALILLAFLATPVVIVVGRTYWKFLTSP